MENEPAQGNGNCLFVFALVCRGWRKAQLKVGGPLRTRVPSDVIAPGRVERAKWALAEGCPRERYFNYNMAHATARYGHLELVSRPASAGRARATRAGPVRRGETKPVLQPPSGSVFV